MPSGEEMKLYIFLFWLVVVSINTVKITDCSGAMVFGNI